MRPSLNQHLYEHGKAGDDLRHLIIDISRAAKYIQSAIRTTEAGLSGIQNQFGEKQLKLDHVSDELIRAHLCESRTVASFASEEQDQIIELDPAAPFSVAYDPLDGSSLAETNFAIGSIFGIYLGKNLLGQTPRKQVAALYVLGPRTILVYGTGNGVHEFLLNEVGEFVLLRQFLGIGDKAKNYSPGNLRAVTGNEKYRKLIDTWLDEELTLRYSGCMVADLHHILTKGQGIFANIGGSDYPQGKLRLAFECGPFAYLIEEAGGKTSDGTQSILDIPLKSIDQRTPIIAGSKGEVERVVKMLG